jgi:hypothetical protein
VSEDNNQSTENTNDGSFTDSECDSFYSDLPHLVREDEEEDENI